MDQEFNTLVFQHLHDMLDKDYIFPLKDDIIKGMCLFVFAICVRSC